MIKVMKAAMILKILMTIAVIKILQSGDQFSIKVTIKSFTFVRGLYIKRKKLN